MAAELSGKVAIVTGGVSGLGRATVELFLKEGARVVIADLDSGRGEDLARALGAAALFKRTDVANADDVQAAVDFAVERFGGLHVMFNNAGISGTTHPRFLDDPLNDFPRMLNVNLLGVMLGTQRAARHMADHGGGSIINNSSMAAIKMAAIKAGFGVMTYRAAKSGVVHFTKSVAIDLAEYGVRVNCIAPGHIRTEMTAYSTPGMSSDAVERVKKAVAAVTDSSRPLKRHGTPEDVAQAALYLASDRSAQITGVVLPVDGGASAGDSVNHLRNILEARTRAAAEEGPLGTESIA
jgi:NAD(P)-dependent dehydrogenase (short-subunit alcohol dehydrogenase family)